MIVAADQERNANLTDLIHLIDVRMRRELSPTSDERVHWYLHGIRAILACKNDHIATGLKLAQEYLAQPERFPLLTETIRCVAAYAYFRVRQWEEFYKVLTVESRTADDEFTCLSGASPQILLGIASIFQLKFARALKYLEESNLLAHKKLGSISLPGALSGGLMAFIHCEMLEINKAEQILSDGILDLVAQCGYIDCTCRTYAAAYRIAVLRQENEYALNVLEKWKKTVSGLH